MKQNTLMETILKRWFPNDKKVTKQILTSIILTVFPAIIFIPFIILRIEIIKNYTIQMWIKLLLGFVWILLSIFFINKYIEKTDLFFLEIQKHASQKQKSEIKKIKNDHRRNFFKINYKTIIWEILIILILINDISYLQKYGILGNNDPYLYIFILALTIVIYYTSFGFQGVFCTIKSIITLEKKNLLLIDYISADDAGGFSHIIKYILFTTKIFSTGILFIPILLDYIYYTKIIHAKLFLYVAIVLFSFSIFLSFFIPLWSIKKYVNKKKNNAISELQKNYYTYIKNINSSVISEKNELRSINIYYYIQLIKNTKVLELDVSTLLQLFISIITPLISLFINKSDIQNIISIIIK